MPTTGSADIPDGAASAKNADHASGDFRAAKGSAAAIAGISARTATLLILAAAVIVGGWLRFAGIGTREMSADEGASWADAMAPTVSRVFQRELHLNPGKAGIHALALHEWIRAFGDGLFAIRSLSAAAGTIAIVLVFFLTRELFALDNSDAAMTQPVSDTDFILPALATAVFAVNLVTIKYSWEARMYPLMLAATLAQVFCLLRAARLGGFVNYAGVALFTAVAVGSNLVAGLMLAAEGAWLVYLIACNRMNFALSATGRALRLIAAMVAGLALLSPLAPGVFRSSDRAVNTGVLHWIKPPHIWDPISLFNKATGSFGFPVIAVLAVLGAVWGWRRARDATVFALCWMWIPPLMLLAVSYLITPVFVERYVLASFAPFFILCAAGIYSLRGTAMRAAALVLVVALSLGHLYSYESKPHGVQWREAVQSAILATKPGTPLAVAPAYARNVVRYYLEHSGRPALSLIAVSSGSYASKANVIIIGSPGVSAAQKARLASEYPDVLARLRGVVVRHR